MKWQVIPLCAALLFGAGGAYATQSEYRAERRDTLSAVFGKHAQAVCDVNKVAGRITNCDAIIAGKSYLLPPGVRARSASAVATMETGEFRWKHVGGAPLLGCGNKTEAVLNEEAWTQMGLTDEDKSELRALVSVQPHQNYTFFKPGDRFQAVAFCKDGQVSFEKNVVAAWSEKTVVLARTYVLKSGRVFHWVRNCNNWVVGTSLPPVTTTKRVEEEEIVELVIPPRKKVVEEEEIVELVIPPRKVVAEQRCTFDPKAVLGQEHGLRTSPNQDHSTFSSGGLYCTKRVGNGYEGPGVGFQASWWHGQEVNFGSTGRFAGRSLAIGPAYEWVRDKGSTTELKLLFGRMHQGFEQAQYESQRTVGFTAVAVAHSDYSRRLRGEKFLPEIKFFAMLGLPTSVDASVANFGQLGETPDGLTRKGLLLQVGVHQDVFDWKYGTLWLRAGYFLEQHLTETMNLRAGLSDPMRICSVGLGPNFDLRRHLKAKGWGWSCDLPTAGQALVGGYRLSQVSDGKTATFGNGAVMTSLEPDDEEQD